MRWATALALSAGLWLACPGTPTPKPPRDGGTAAPSAEAAPGDAGQSDAGLEDAGTADAGPSIQAAGQDAGQDAGPPDAGTSSSDSGPDCQAIAGGATACSGAACPFASASPGDVVSLGGLSVASLPPPALAAAAAPGAATLLFSDDPETVPSPGLLYADQVGPGPVRLFIYHVNGAASPLKLTVVLENDDPAKTVQVKRLVIARAGPSTNYLYVGKVAVERWFQGVGGAPLAVGPSQALLLDPALDATAIAQGELMHGIYDLSLDGPLRVSIVALASHADTLATFGTLGQLPRGAHQRGTFSPAEVLAGPSPDGCAYDTAFGATRVALGTPGPAGIRVPGIDATTGTAMTLSGQYGVRSTVDLAVSSSDGRSLALLLAPRGGAYGGAAIDPKGTLVLLPNAQTSLADPTKALLLQTLSPGATPRDLSLVWTLPGGSSGPVDLLLVPY